MTPGQANVRARVAGVGVMAKIVVSAPAENRTPIIKLVYFDYRLRYLVGDHERFLSYPFQFSLHSRFVSYFTECQK